MSSVKSVVSRNTFLQPVERIGAAGGDPDRVVQQPYHWEAFGSSG